MSEGVIIGLAVGLTVLLAGVAGVLVWSLLVSAAEEEPKQNRSDGDWEDGA
jgi:hypothetical protein